MRALVVYESMYGNTHAVAEAVATGLGDSVEVSVCTTNDAVGVLVAESDLLVVGGPTHVHGMVSSRSRKGAIEEAGKNDDLELDPAVESEGLRAWLGALNNAEHAHAAAFDTRMSGAALLTGSAAQGIARRLHQKGFDLVSIPASFVVEHSEGPLREGELERAQGWGRQLGAALATTSVEAVRHGGSEGVGV